MPHKTQVALIGKSTSLDSKKLHREVLNSIEPTEVPKEFISGIDLVLGTGKILKFDMPAKEGTFSMAEVTEFINEKKIAEHVARIEITLDLDLISSKLSSEADHFLSRFFDE